jgi:hypothetical protein
MQSLINKIEKLYEICLKRMDQTEADFKEVIFNIQIKF